jgi:hypothetical protein
MLVQATDGFYYKEVVITAPNGLVMLLDEVCAVVVRVHRNTSEVAARSRANKLVRELGMTGKVLEGHMEAVFLFPDGLDAGYQFDFVPLAPIPVPAQFSCRVSEPCSGEMCCGFWTDFKLCDIIDFLNERCTLPLLERALLGEWITGQRSLVKRRLFKQHPRLRDIRGELWHSDAPVRVRVTWDLKAVKAPFDLGFDL